MPGAQKSWRLLALAAGALCAPCIGASAPAAVDAEGLAKAKGCLACHAVDKKAVGPTYREVAKKFAGDANAEARIASSIVKGTPPPGGVGWQKEGKAALPFMPPNSSLLPDEAATLARWIAGL